MITRVSDAVSFYVSDLVSRARPGLLGNEEGLHAGLQQSSADGLPKQVHLSARFSSTLCLWVEGQGKGSLGAARGLDAGVFPGIANIADAIFQGADEPTLRAVRHWEEAVQV